MHLSANHDKYITASSISGSNNIINFTFSKDFYNIADKVIINLIIFFLYLFSALEEVDWKVCSNYKNTTTVIDESSWKLTVFFDRIIIKSLNRLISN